jgi:glycerol-3-phosphate dehydrogenase
VILGLIARDSSLASVAIPGQHYVNAEFVYAVRYEMATSLMDLLTRRTRAHLHDARATLKSAHDIARLVGPELEWSDDECERQVEAYRQLVDREFAAAGLNL